MIAKGHYDEQTLGSLLSNRLGDSEDEVVAHVEACAECQDRLEGLLKHGLSWEDVGDVLRKSQASQEAQQRERSDEEPEGLRLAATFLEPTDHPGSLGRFARYEIMELLGRGGMGIVMRGYDPSLNRHSAVKVLAPELASSAAARRRFSREAKSAAAVVHPHVVPIHTVDEHNGLPYLVMPVVEGQSLQQRVEQDGPLEIIEVVRIASQVTEGLAAAHAQGLVHRDIKPANVLLENGVERVQITDFGLARAIDDASMTRSGVIAGTPQYMSPEQAHGDSIDHRSDLFSLGSLIYYMLTGRSPFRAETTMGVLNRIVNDEPRPIREINADVPEWLEAIVARLLSKSADARYQTAGDVIDVLRDRTHKPPTLQPAARRKIHTAPPPRKVARWLIATGFGGLLALLGTIIVLETNQGTITIESGADNVPIRIMQNDKVVEKLTVTKSPQSVRIAAGEYTIAVDGDFDGIVLDKNTVSLNRGGTEIVKISRLPEASNAHAVRSDELGASESLHTFDKSQRDITLEQSALEQLQTEYSVIEAKYSQAAQQAADEVELNRVYQEMDPREIMPPKYLAMEEQHRGTQPGLAALVEVAGMARSVGDPNSNAAKGRVEAIRRIVEHYLHFEGLAAVVASLGGGPFVPQADEFLQALVEKSPYRKTQAEALIAQILQGMTILQAESQLPTIRIEMKVRLAVAPPHVQAEFEECLAALEKTDFNQLRRNLNKKLEQLSERYSDVAVEHYGSGGAAAQRLSHAINQVIVGEQAPEIAHPDLDGKPFRLSKLRGKIVVLLFAQSVADDYGEMYAPVRQLVARYKQFPVRVVGVMSNSDQAALRAAAKRGELTWTVIPQALNGPLQLDWGIEGYPSVYIIDADGVLHPQLHMPNYGDGGYDTKDVVEAIDKLLNANALPASESTTSSPLPVREEAEKVSNSFDHSDAQSFEAILANYNEETRQARRELFDPPIPDMTLEQLRQGFVEGAKEYRSIGKTEIANLLQRFAEKGRLDDGLLFYVGGTDYAPTGQSGKRHHFKQFAPSLNVDVPSKGSKQNVVLSSIELRYSSDGYRSKTYGDIHPPLDGTWELVQAQQGETEVSGDLLSTWLENSPGFSQLIIRDHKLVMPMQGKPDKLAGQPTPEDSITYDLKFDYSTMVPRFVASRGGVVTFDGIFSSDGFVEDKELNILLPLGNGQPPRTFKEKGEKTLYLKYQRQLNVESGTDEEDVSDKADRPHTSAKSDKEDDAATSNPVRAPASIIGDKASDVATPGATHSYSVAIVNGTAEIAASIGLPYEYLEATIEKLKDSGIRRIKFFTPSRDSTRDAVPR